MCEIESDERINSAALHSMSKYRNVSHPTPPARKDTSRTSQDRSLLKVASARDLSLRFILPSSLSNLMLHSFRPSSHLENSTSSISYINTARISQHLPVEKLCPLREDHSLCCFAWKWSELRVGITRLKIKGITSVISGSGVVLRQGKEILNERSRKTYICQQCFAV